MQKEYYTVELIFNPKDMSACAGVRSFLEGFKHLTPNRIEAAIEKGKILLKRNVGYKEACAILQHVRIEGAKCNLKKQVLAQPDDTRMDKNKLTDNTVAKVVAKDVVCPKCSSKQLFTTECRHCGIVFSKIHDPRKPSDRLDARDNAKREEWQLSPGLVSEGPPAKRLTSVRLLIARMAGWRRNVNKWTKKPLSALIDCGVMTLTALFLEITLLFIGKYLWFILSSTQVGEYYAQTHPDAAALIEAILGSGATVFSTHVVLWVLTTNLLLSLFAQITHLARFYLDSDSVVVKCIWILSSALLSAWGIYQKELCPSLPLTFVLTLPPTFCLLKSCLNLTKTILPEMGGIVSRIVKNSSNWDSLLTGIKKLWRA